MTVERARSSDGTTVAFERQGEGEPVLLVHGTAGSMASWAMFVPQLVEHFEVINMDRRGRGSSGDGESHSLDLEIDDVAAVVEAVGEPVHLVGHSFGARVALEASARGVPLRSLSIYEAVIATQHSPDDLVARAESLMRDGDVDRAAELFLIEGATISPDELEFLKALPPVWEQITAGMATAPREVRALDGLPVDLSAVGKIAVPVLVLVGANTTSPLYLDGLDEIERSIPDARRELLPGQGHLAAGFAPEVLAELIKSFLVGLESPSR